MGAVGLLMAVRTRCKSTLSPAFLFMCFQWVILLLRAVFCILSTFHPTVFLAIALSKGSTFPCCLYRHQNSYLASVSSVCMRQLPSTRSCMKDFLAAFSATAFGLAWETHYLLSTLHFPNEVLTLCLALILWDRPCPKPA